jgi:LysM repeat protein
MKAQVARVRRGQDRGRRARGFLSRYQAIVVTAALVVAVAGCGGVPTGASLSAGTGSSAAPAASPAAASPRVTPKPSRVTVATPTAKPVATGRLHWTVYVIKTGDTLYAIAIRFKVSVQAILAANPGITNSNQLTIGQKILIPTR